MKNHYDLLVIGAGSGGLAAAQKAAENGASVAIVEMKTIGGTCVNVGCVPKKLTWYAGETESFFTHAKEYGFQAKSPALSFKKLAAHRQHYLKLLNKKYHQRLQTDNITYLQGDAKFTNSHTVKVANKLYTAKHIIIATGCSPNTPMVEGGAYAIDSDGFFALKSLPKSMAIIGGGYIAMEFSSILNKLGVDVHLVIRDDKPLKQFDSLISKALLELIKLKKIKLYKHQEVKKITRNAQKKLTLHCNSKKITNIDSVLFAIGRHPCTNSLNLKAAGVKLNKAKYIATDKWENTNVAHIYAIGDVTGKKMQTPVAVAAGRKLASRLFGGEKRAFLDYDNIPTTIFTHPPAASVGLTEQQAVDKYGRKQLAIYEAKFASLYYAFSKEKIFSYIKLITIKKSQKVIGCHFVDNHADEIIQGFAVAIKMGATKMDFDNTVGIHPTSAEELLTLKNSARQGAEKSV
jgi:glutathione reductase (NADPH)